MLNHLSVFSFPLIRVLVHEPLRGVGVCLVPLLLLGSCSGGGGAGGSSNRLELEQASHGFGRLLPHQVAQLDDAGQALGSLIEIRRVQDLLDHVTDANGILAPISWPAGAVLPNADAGNHFLFATFSLPIDPASVLELDAGANGENNLGGALVVEFFDAGTGTVLPIAGRAFVGGVTTGGLDPDQPGRLALESWVAIQDGEARALDVAGALPGIGFPGTQSQSFAGARELLGPNAIVFVPDADGDLSTHETFPVGVQVRMRISKAVCSTSGAALEDEALASATVGSDSTTPEVMGSDGIPAIFPGNGDIDVDPETSITIEFSEAVQPRSVGDLDDGTSPALSSSIQLQFGPSTGRVTVPFHVRPFSPFDLSRYELLPTYPFPGSGPTLPGVSCGDFSTVDINLVEGLVQDLGSNVNSRSAETFFVTMEGAGLVNAPVTPDAIYALRLGARPGISALDLNGFGAGPGNPSWDFQNPIQEGNSNYPNNPNVLINGSGVIPGLSPGTCVFDGGSRGVFSLSQDTSLGDVLLTTPLIQSPVDMALGHALDLTFNNSLPFGCQAGGGNICAQTGLKRALLVQGGPTTLRPPTGGEVILATLSGQENLVNWAPHPNPPPLTFPPLCLSPLIAALEPTSVSTAVPNLLVPGGAPLGRPDLGIPPDGLLTSEQNIFFQGPTPPQTQVTNCQSYALRQQIGQFLYVADRRLNEIVVLNSNRFSVIDRIPVSDPTSLAMSPNLDLMAVTSSGTDQVIFIDTDPASSSFHTVVKRTSVGSRPSGVAWESGNEDILVCNSGDNSMSIVSAFSLNVRKTVTSLINNPIDVAITPRQTSFGFLRNVYFAYVLNGDGSIAVFESGPNGINGWGFDDMIGSPPIRFDRPKAIQPDILDLRSGVWIAHENPLDQNGLATGQSGGALSKLALSSATSGQIPLNSGAFTNPSLRDLQFSVIASIGEGPGGLTGIPTDLAFDDLRNLGALANPTTTFSAGTPVRVNGKSLIRQTTAGVVPASAPSFLFVAVPTSSEGPGVIDVIDLSGLQRFDTNPFQGGIQSVPCSGVVTLMNYWRQ